VSTGHSTKKIKVVEYDDDITVSVTGPEEFNAIRQVICRYERASRAHLNPGKFKALAIGDWTTPAQQLGIALKPSVKRLSIIFAATT
jgi:hypothetical protein